MTPAPKARGFTTEGYHGTWGGGSAGEASVKHRTCDVIRQRWFFTYLCFWLVCFVVFIGLPRASVADPGHRENLGNGWAGQSSFENGNFRYCSVDKIIAPPGMGVGLILFANRDSDLSLDLYLPWNFFPPKGARDISVRVNQTTLQTTVDYAKQGSANLWLTDILKSLNEISEGDQITLSWRGREVSASLHGSRAAVHFMMRCIQEHGSAELKAKLGIAPIPAPTLPSLATWKGEVDCNNPPPVYTDADIDAPMHFFSSDDGCTGRAVSMPYMAVGKITKDTPATFAEFAKKNGPSVAIQFVSRGGNLFAALKLAEMIRVRGYDTSLGEICASACAYAIIGGNRRYILQQTEPSSDYDTSFVVGGKDAKLGIHQFYKTDALADPLQKAFTAADVSADQMLIGLLLEFTLRMRVDTHFVSAASGVLPQRVRWVTSEEMLSWNIDNVQRRYSPLVFRSLGDSGSYVEVSNTRGSDTPSYFRMLCQSSAKEPIFTFIVDAPPGAPMITVDEQVRESTERVQNILGRMDLKLDFGASKAVHIPFQIQQVSGDRRANGAVRVSAVVRPSGFALQDAERLAHVALEDNGRLARADWAFQDVVKFKILGDHKLIRLVMRNCIE